VSPDLKCLLRDTSRSFYLTLRVLPGAIRPQIGLAYLLARATDTIADTEAVPLGERLAALDQMRRRILGETNAVLDFARFTGGTSYTSPHPPEEWEGMGTRVTRPSEGTSAERALLSRINEAIAALEQFSAADRQRIREVLGVITGGQELDLRRFAGASERNIVVLQTAAELDDYTWRVAGCVGGFWTKMCRAHLFPKARLDETQFLTDAIRFGKGLQLVNILRDLPRDLRHGRCYLPADELRGANLAPADLLQPESIAKLRPVYDAWLARAEAHLSTGWDYTNSLPRNQRRVRLACAWPVLIGARTLALLRAGNPLDPARRIKVSRAEVRGILLRSLLALGSARLWRRQLDRVRR